VLALCALRQYRDKGHWTGHLTRLNRDLSGNSVQEPTGRRNCGRNLASVFVGTTPGLWGSAGIREAVYSSKSLKIRQPFVPPNPKLFDSAYLIAMGRA
jgi:antirestriction protein ArdC